MAAGRMRWRRRVPGGRSHNGGSVAVESVGRDVAGCRGGGMSQQQRHGARRPRTVFSIAAVIFGKYSRCAPRAGAPRSRTSARHGTRRNAGSCGGAQGPAVLGVCGIDHMYRRPSRGLWLQVQGHPHRRWQGRAPSGETALTGETAFFLYCRCWVGSCLWFGNPGV